MARQLISPTAMIRGLYNAANGLRGAERNHEIVAHNLANANMPGFRRQVVVSESFNQALISATSAMGAAHAPASSDVRTAFVFEPGEHIFTDNRLDVAIEGDAFFVVEGPNGPLYTRNGVFGIGPGGVLQSSSGLPVLGDSGRLTVPDATAQVTIQRDGTIDAGGVPIGKLKLVRFDDPSVLEPAGTTLFKAPASLRPPDASATVHQGYRESSNVHVVDELVRMIAGSRLYEASQRAIRALADSMEQNIRGHTG